MDKNKAFMAEALKEAAIAAEMGEVPIGAVIVRGDEIIASAHNLVETTRDPTAHAEMLAIRQAAARLGGWRLTGCHMYVTVEPCSMCAGAIVWARIEKLYIGTDDPKGGACGSIFNIPQEKKLNHYTEIETGLLREECSEIMKTFFRKIRDRKSEDNQ
ncbi:MAG: tRNA adenosine(34) deaminase TadA [Lentihominibacter sp.]